MPDGKGCFNASCLKSIHVIFSCFQDLYFQYIWNNFLHTQVEQCLGLVLRCGRPDPKPESDAELDSALDRTPPYSPSDVKVSDPSEPEPSEVSESDGTQPESSSTHLESPLLPQVK